MEAYDFKAATTILELPARNINNSNPDLGREAPETRENSEPLSGGLPKTPRDSKSSYGLVLSVSGDTGRKQERRALLVLFPIMLVKLGRKSSYLLDNLLTIYRIRKQANLDSSAVEHFLSPLLHLSTNTLCLIWREPLYNSSRMAFEDLLPCGARCVVRYIGTASV